MRVGDRFNPFRLFHGILIPESICRFSGLRSGAKICYGRLLRYAGESGECHPSIPTLAAEIAVSQRQARTYLAQLVEHRFIRKVSRGDGRSNRFEFLWHEIFDAEARKKTAGVPRKNTSAHPGRILPAEESHRKNIPPWGVSFDGWWDVYPRKVAKADGRRAFEQVIVLGRAKNGLQQDLHAFADFDARREQLMAVTRAWAENEFSQRPADKVPYPATFIRRGDWLAAPEAKQRTLDGFKRAWES